MKKSVNRFWSYLLSCIVTLLGFSCETESRDEYGAPFVNFTVKCKVTDEANNPIKGICVSIDHSKYGMTPLKYTASNTDENGEYIQAYTSWQNIPSDLEVKFTDVDGEANGGSFEEVTIVSPASDYIQTKQGKGWWKGDYEVTINQSLKKENQ